MTGTEIVIAIVGLALVTAGYYGFTAFLESRKEVHLEEVRGNERKQALETMSFVSQSQFENFNKVVDRMQSGNEAAQKALLMALNTNENILRAASQTKETVVAGNSLSNIEAMKVALDREGIVFVEGETLGILFGQSTEKR
jgi:hypothetical protein